MIIFSVIKWSVLNRLLRFTFVREKMVEYKCFYCSKAVSDEYVKKRVRCPYCGSKILVKPSAVPTKVKAR